MTAVIGNRRRAQ